MYGYSQDEDSEKIIGEWMEERGIRDQIVVATKARWFLSLKRKRFLTSGTVHNWL